MADPQICVQRGTDRHMYPFKFLTELCISFLILQSSFRKKLHKFQKLESNLSVKYENIGAKLSSYDKDYEDILMISMGSTTAGKHKKIRLWAR